jgi:hypothetical protein
MDLIDLILSLPMFWKIFLISILVFSNIAYLFRKQLAKSKIGKKFVSMWSGKKIILTDHKLFNESAYIIYKINRINLGDERKNKLFQKLLLIKYESIKKNTKLLIANKDLSKLSNSQFYAFVIKNMTLIVDEYNEKMKFYCGEEIYNLIMLDEDKGFNNIHEKTIVFIKGAVEETFESEHLVYSAEDKIDFLLDLYYIAMKIAMTDVEKVYKNFNGDLDKLLKKSKLCP